MSTFNSPLMTNFPTGFEYGISIRGIPILTTFSGVVAYVSSTTGSDGNRPGTLQQPFATLNGALTGNGNAWNPGDLIVCLPGHAETITTSTAISITNAGLTVLGLGTGNSRPTFTYQTSTAATINVQAADTTFVNCLFIANLAATVSVFTLTTAKNFTIQNCEFRDTAANKNFINVVTNSTTANAADFLTIRNCVRAGGGNSVNSTIVNALGTLDRLVITGCRFEHASTSSPLGGIAIVAAGKSLTNILVADNTCDFTSADTSPPVGILLTANTSGSGKFTNNVITLLAQVTTGQLATALLTTTNKGYQFDNNRVCIATADKSGIVVPAVQT